MANINMFIFSCLLRYMEILLIDRHLWKGFLRTLLKCTVGCTFYFHLSLSLSLVTNKAFEIVYLSTVVDFFILSVHVLLLFSLNAKWVISFCCCPPAK